MEKYKRYFDEGNKGYSIPSSQKFKGSLYSRLNKSSDTTSVTQKWVDKVIAKVEYLKIDNEEGGIEDLVLDIINDLRVLSSLKKEVYNEVMKEL